MVASGGKIKLLLKELAKTEKLSKTNIVVLKTILNYFKLLK